MYSNIVWHVLQALTSPQERRHFERRRREVRDLHTGTQKAFWEKGSRKKGMKDVKPVQLYDVYH